MLKPNPTQLRNQLYYGDNLAVMKALLHQHGACIDLCYIDPPFNSQRDYNVPFKAQAFEQDEAQEAIFKDTWSNVAYQDHLSEIKKLGHRQVAEFLTYVQVHLPAAYTAYLSMMALRLHYIHLLLKDTGSLYVHCDQVMSHYLKLLLDAIFGKTQYRNEIIWHYKGTGRANKHFPRKHDVLLFYAKKDNLFHPIRVAAAKTSGWTGKNTKWCDDTWADIQTVYQSEERNQRKKYPTQKPFGLLRRIIQASSNEGDLVADFFCGSGTTLAVAQELHRRWIGVDIIIAGINFAEEWLKKKYGTQLTYQRQDLIP